MIRRSFVTGVLAGVVGFFFPRKIKASSSGEGVLRFGDAVRVVILDYLVKCPSLDPDGKGKAKDYLLSGYITFIDDFYLNVRSCVEWEFTVDGKVWRQGGITDRKGPWYHDGCEIKIERIEHAEVSRQEYSTGRCI